MCNLQVVWAEYHIDQVPMRMSIMYSLTLFKVLDESHLMNTNDANWICDKEKPAPTFSFDLSTVGDGVRPVAS
jgi:hypothetical protein